MTVAGLVALLRQHDPELPVYVQGYLGGLEDLEPEQVGHVSVLRDQPPSEYFGSHALVGSAAEGVDPAWCPSASRSSTSGLVLARDPRVLRPIEEK